MDWNRTSQGTNFRYASNTNFVNGSVSIGISYRFGKLDTRVKKVERTIVNDDISSSPKGSSKGGM